MGICNNRVFWYGNGCHRYPACSSMVSDLQACKTLAEIWACSMKQDTEWHSHSPGREGFL
ncbi:hypothetical protein PAXRUDRAFT_804550 [Paxillus rubicundulus Ve08.2h10]|uniref:Uncharacterized protein n=1 Tax=Paxillus rubicundulus Ve08.2h10 TaxID=930991 RepID=A0A0D0CII9_9AGAM|nr:hypothetical protein PAXRUDRAFT_804550 [Paxillus rubicundulus Ve08.2h10]